MARKVYDKVWADEPDRAKMVQIATDFLVRAIGELHGEPSAHDLEHARFSIETAMIWLPDE